MKIFLRLLQFGFDRSHASERVGRDRIFGPRGLTLAAAFFAFAGAAFAQSVTITGPSGTANSPVTITGTFSGATGAINVTANGSTSNMANSGQAATNSTTGTWSIVWSPTQAGDYTIKATPATGASATSTITIAGPPSVALALTGGSATVPQGSSRYLVATVSASAVQKVDFYLDTNTLIATSTTAPYTLLLTAPDASGFHTLNAVATDNTGLQGTSNTVSVQYATAFGSPPTVGLNPPATGAFFPLGVTTQLSGTVSDADGSVAGVTVFVNGVTGAAAGLANGGAATVTNGNWSINWTPAATGTATLSAIAADGQGNAVVSNVVPVSVTDSTSPAIALAA